MKSNETQSLLSHFILFASVLILILAFAQVSKERNEAVAQLEENQINQIILDHGVYTMSDEVKEKMDQLENASIKHDVVMDYCEILAPESDGSEFGKYLHNRDVPNSINVDGQELYANELFAREDCLLVYGDQFDIPEDMQLFTKGSFQYIGFDIDQNLVENPLRKN